MTTTTLSIVQYSNNNVTSPQKLNNILQQSTTIVNNKAERIILVRKQPQPILPATKEILLTNKAKKQRLERSKECIKPSASSAPVAVARRNARERNRVKQVNNGFATLRQHIPDVIAAAYESSSGKGGNKKLSKVETLRMAVEYIRSLEDILASDDCDSSLLSSCASSSPSSPTVTTTSAGGTTYTYPLILSPCQEDDDLFSITSTPPPPLQPQYIRIPGTNTYQMLDPALYDDSENLEPLDMELVDADLMDSDIGTDLLNSISTVDDSLSPADVYSDECLSPLSSTGTTTLHNNQKKDNLVFIPLFDSSDLISNEEVKFRISPAVTTTTSINGSTDTTVIKLSSPLVTMMNKKDNTPNAQVLVKMEQPERNDVDEESKENNMLQVMAWWQEQQEQESQTRS